MWLGLQKVITSTYWTYTISRGWKDGSGGRCAYGACRRWSSVPTSRLPFLWIWMKLVPIPICDLSWLSCDMHPKCLVHLSPGIFLCDVLVLVLWGKVSDSPGWPQSLCTQEWHGSSDLCTSTCKCWVYRHPLLQPLHGTGIELSASFMHATNWASPPASLFFLFFL